MYYGMGGNPMEALEFFPIDIEQTSWSASSEQLSKLRHQVFVEEQGVSEAEEFDGADEDAVHWLAYGAGDRIIGCARLCGDKVGRMAVNRSFRNKGVGSALMRRIIRYASRNGIESLQLNAQSHAVPFYEGMYDVIIKTFFRPES
jgi:predicted GNAT family N-acyltransferase